MPRPLEESTELLLRFAQDTFQAPLGAGAISEGFICAPQHPVAQGTLGAAAGDGGGNNPCGLAPGNDVNVSNVASERWVLRGHVGGCPAQGVTVLQPVFLSRQKEANGGGMGFRGRLAVRTMTYSCRLASFCS